MASPECLFFLGLACTRSLTLSPPNQVLKCLVHLGVIPASQSRPTPVCLPAWIESMPPTGPGTPQAAARLACVSMYPAERENCTTVDLDSVIRIRCDT